MAMKADAGPFGRAAVAYMHYGKTRRKITEERKVLGASASLRLVYK